MTNQTTPQEGTLYKTLHVGGKIFHIVYGYYSEQEKLLGEPIPVLPDLAEDPTHGKDGYRIVTHIQDVCSHYRPRESISSEDWCADCTFYQHPKDEISVCLCADHKQKEETS